MGVSRNAALGAPGRHEVLAQSTIALVHGHIHLVTQRMPHITCRNTAGERLFARHRARGIECKFARQGTRVSGAKHCVSE